MKENMRLSIIIPAYNAERYIENCLESLLRQSLGGWKFYALMTDQRILLQT